MRRLIPLFFFFLLPSSIVAADVEKGSYIERVFSQGERIEYTLTWLGVAGGEAVITVTPGEGRFTIHTLARTLGAIGRLYPVRDEIETVVSSANFSTLRFEKRLNERGREKHVATLFDPKRKVATRLGEEIPYEPPIFDPMSSIYYLRTLDLTPGKKHMMTIIADSEVYEIAAEVLAREEIEIQGSRFRTVLVEPKMRKGGIFRDENNRLLIWYTDDARRVPVRIRSELAFGSITATIRNSRLGSQAPAGKSK
jgi:hypothetical protein